MVESIGTNATLQAQRVAASEAPRSTVVEQAAPRTVQSRVNRPDAPVRVSVNPFPIASQSTASASSAREKSGEAAPKEAQRAPITPLIGDSGLTTYRDQESGRLIVRVFDRESGDVLLEFPPEGQRHAIKALAPSLASPKTEYLA
jgi:hypothetical protein